MQATSNIPVAALSQVGLPNTEAYILFYDSENNFHLTGVKNINGSRVVVDYENSSNSIVVNLNAAQIQTLKSVPVNTGIPNPGVGKAIEILTCVMKYTFGTVAFNNDTVNLINTTLISTPDQFQLGADNQLSNAVNSMTKFWKGQQNFAFSTNNVVENDTVSIQSNADSVGFGDGYAKFYITYRIITL